MPRPAIEIIAHRGYSARAPENTAASIEAAILEGADAIEWDLQFTREGVAVVFHDEDLLRTAGIEGRIADRSLEDLRSLDVGSWFDPGFAGESIVSFEEILHRVRGRIPRIYPEIKGSPDAARVERLVREVRDAGWADRTTLIAMDWEVLDRIRSLDPQIGIGYVIERADRWEEAFRRSIGDPRAILDPDHRILLEDPTRAHRARAEGIPLAVWTVDDPAIASALLPLGVTRFTTNRVRTLLDWRDALGGER